MRGRERKASVVVRRLRSLWLKIKQHQFIATAIIVVLVAVVIFIFAAYTFGWDWTGFNSGYGQVTTHAPAKDTVSPPAKTLWDWLQLLIIPVVLAVTALLFNGAISRNEQRLTIQ